MNSKWNELRNLLEEALFEEKALKSDVSTLLFNTRRRKKRYEKELADLEDSGFDPPEDKDEDGYLGCGMEDGADESEDEHV